MIKAKNHTALPARKALRFEPGRWINLKTVGRILRHIGRGQRLIYKGAFFAFTANQQAALFFIGLRLRLNERGQRGGQVKF